MSQRPFGRIYKIFWANEPAKLYIGSTYSSLAERLREHKHFAKLPTANSKFYQFVRRVPSDELRIELLLEVPQVQKKTLLQLEGHFQRVYETCTTGFNTNLAGGQDNEVRLQKMRVSYKARYELYREKELQRNAAYRAKKKAEAIYEEIHPSLSAI